jgi:hypothetical protein
MPSSVGRYLWPQVLIIAGLLALTTCIFHLQLFDGWSFPWDFVGPYTATPPLVADTFGHGQPLAWSPFVASGFPIDVDPQAGVYFPVWWLLGILRIPATLSILTVVQVAHVFFGGVGMLFLARIRRLSWQWAAVSAVAYLFFGGFYGQAEHADYFRGFSYLPWLLWTLTPPVDEDDHWTRLVALPPMAWLIASGAYPGQIVSFGIAGLIYVSVAMRIAGLSVWRKHRNAFILASVASVCVCVVVLVPHIRAEQAGELFRQNEPTAAARAGFSFGPLDIFGLYLSNFAWTSEGTITAWVVGIPILMGLSLVRQSTLRSQIPLIVSGLAALALAMTPKIGFIGKTMASVRLLFPSRFPAADYKAIVAVALILISADAWSHISSRRDRRPWIAVTLAGCVLVGGALLVPRTYADPTGRLWLLVAVATASIGLALIRPRVGVLACSLVILLVVNGAQEIRDYRLGGVASPWQIPPTDLSFYHARDTFVRELPYQLEQTPPSRPARVPPAPQPEPDASGWVADAYHVSDYDTSIERLRWRAQHNSAWLTLLLAPWHGYTFPCPTISCQGVAAHLPLIQKWRPSPYIHTTSYGLSAITYSVDTAQPMLLVENELAIRGWRANTTRVHAVDVNLPFRAWSLAPGHYQFTATFQEPGRLVQYIALVTTLTAWLGCIFILLSSRLSFGANSHPTQRRLASDESGT